MPVFDKFIHEVGNFLKKNGSYILAGLGVVGVAGTAVVSAIDTKRYLNNTKPNATAKEKAINIVKNYIPTAAVVTATSACIVGSVLTNRSKIGSLASSLGLVSAAYTGYQNKTKELYGEEVNEKVKQEVALDRYLKNKAEYDKMIQKYNKPLIYCEYLIGEDKYFCASLEDVWKGINEAKDIFIDHGNLSADELIKCIDSELDADPNVGWNYDQIVYGYDSNTVHLMLKKLTFDDDSQPIYELYSIEQPEYDYLDWYEKFFGSAPKK